MTKHTTTEESTPHANKCESMRDKMMKECHTKHGFDIPRLVDFIQKEIEAAKQEERERIVQLVEEYQEDIRKETGAFKYDFIFENITNLINCPDV